MISRRSYASRSETNFRNSPFFQHPARRGVYMRKWQKVLIAIVVFATVAHGTFPAKALADKLDSDQIEGSWYITIQLTDPFQLTFDATYTFAEGGAFTRIDGRNNAPAVGTWKHTEDGRFIFSHILFNFNNGVRNGAIAGKFAANVIN